MSYVKHWRNGGEQDTNRITPFMKWVQTTHIKLKDHNLTARVFYSSAQGLVYSRVLNNLVERGVFSFWAIGTGETAPCGLSDVGLDLCPGTFTPTGGVY